MPKSKAIKEIELTPKQQAAVDAFVWLLSMKLQDRASGRSTVLAVAFLKHAIDNPLTKVFPLDNDELCWGILVRIKKMFLIKHIVHIFEMKKIKGKLIVNAIDNSIKYIPPKNK